MVRIEKEMAIIMTVNFLIDSNRKLEFGYSEVSGELRLLEAQTGYAILQGFSQESLEEWMAGKYNLFTHVYDKDRKVFRLNIDKILRRSLESWEDPTVKVDRLTGDRLVNKLIDLLDPALNYPIDVFEASDILRFLEADSE